MSVLHLGLAPGAPRVPDPAEWHASLIADAVRAEDLGYSSVWIPESHFGDESSLPQPLLILAAIAARTQRIRLGTSSYLLPFRHPVRVAEEVGVLDQISNGRVILGVGRGFRKPLFRAMGIAPGTKRAHFENTLATLLRLWSGEPAAEPRAYVRPLPVQRPHPPIWVAAFGPKGLAQAAHFGFPYLASPIEALERLQANQRLHRAGLPPEIDADSLAVPAIRSLFVSERPEALRRVREGLAAQARAIAERVGAALPHTANREVDDWALVGEPSRVVEQIERYREAIGLTHLIVRLQVPGALPDEVEASMRALPRLAASTRIG